MSSGAADSTNQGLACAPMTRRSAPQQRAEAVNAVWRWDFVADPGRNGTRFRVLTLIEEDSRVVDVIVIVEAAMNHGRPRGSLE